MKSRDLGRVFSPLGTSVQHGDGVWREGSVGFCPALMCDALSEYAEVRGCVQASRPHGPQERGSAPPPSPPPAEGPAWQEPPVIQPR